MDLIRLVTQLPLSELGERLLHLQAGSKLGLYLLELSNLPLGPGAVEEAETNLSRPLHWLLQQLDTRDPEITLGQYIALFSQACEDPEITAGIEPVDPARLSNGMKVFFTLALQTGLITLDQERVMISLMGSRQLRHPAPMLPLIARAFTTGDNHGNLLCLVICAMTLTFRDREWASHSAPYEAAAELLAEMQHEASQAEILETMQTFDDLCYAAGCPSATSSSARVLLQYLVSEVLQPE